MKAFLSSRLLTSALLGLLVTSACGSDDGSGSSSGSSGGGASDPRCNDLCAVDEPSLEGAGDICSQESANACKESCNARLAGVSSACGTCLLAGAEFGTDDGTVLGSCEGPADECNGGALCETAGREGICAFCEGDRQQEEDCIRQVNPRREVRCETEYRDPAECADLCE